MRIIKSRNNDKFYIVWHLEEHNAVHFCPDGSLDTNLNVDEENIKLYKKGKI
ncbi:hypothetical protein ig2599ANME_0845 [groundwater metagenome]